MEEERFLSLLDEVYFSRREDAQKGDFGRLLLLGGSKIYPNALLLAGKGATCAGVGYLSFYASPEVRALTKKRAPLTAIYLDDLDEDSLKPYDAILFGNGFLENEENEKTLSFLLKNLSSKQTLFIDATGIRLYKKLAKEHACQLVLTPHLGEASFLLEEETISRNPQDHLVPATSFCKKNNCYILLKGSKSLLITPKGGVKESASTPTPSLAKAGSGDVLAGYLSALTAVMGKMGNDLEEIILFGDILFHQVFEEAEKQESQALLSAIDFPRLLKKYLRKRHP